MVRNQFEKHQEIWGNIPTSVYFFKDSFIHSLMGRRVAEGVEERYCQVDSALSPAPNTGLNLMTLRIWAKINSWTPNWLSPKLYFLGKLDIGHVFLTEFSAPQLSLFLSKAVTDSVDSNFTIQGFSSVLSGWGLTAYMALYFKLWVLENCLSSVN